MSSKSKPLVRSSSVRSTPTKKKQTKTSPTSPIAKASANGGMQEYVPLSGAVAYSNGRSSYYPAATPQFTAADQLNDYGNRPSRDSRPAATSRTAIIPVSTLVWTYLNKFHHEELEKACGYLPVANLNPLLSESEQVVIDRRHVDNVRVNEVQILEKQYTVVHQTIDLKPFQAKPDAMTVISALVEREYAVLFTRYSNNNNNNNNAMEINGCYVITGMQIRVTNASNRLLDLVAAYEADKRRDQFIPKLTNVYSIRGVPGVPLVISEPGRLSLYKISSTAGAADVISDVVIRKGDVTTEKLEAIVSTIDSQLTFSSGMSQVVLRAAGSQIATEARALMKRNKRQQLLGVADNVVTRGGLLPVHYIIHTVGPTYRDGQSLDKCDEWLTLTFTNCLKKGDELRVSSLALPFIGSGNSNMSMDLIVSSFCEAVLDYLTNRPVASATLRTIRLVLFDDDAVDTFRHQFVKYLELSNRLDLTRALPQFYPLSTAENRGSKAGLGAGSGRGSREAEAGAASSGTESGSDSPYDTADELEQGVDALGMDHHRSKQQQKPPQSNKRCYSCHVPLKTLNTLKCGHPGCDTCARRTNAPCTYCLAKPTTTATTSLSRESPVVTSSRLTASTATADARSDVSKRDMCVICMDAIKRPKSLGCGHVFCKECIEKSFAYQERCPTCGYMEGTAKGYQPPGGSMTQQILPNQHLAGYPGCGTIAILYQIPAGIQRSTDPSPNKRYQGTKRSAYLPNNAEGQEVLGLLVKAFAAGLTFILGRSATSGEDDVITWNDIHHKTSNKPGDAHGYPDPTYLQRVKQELADKGIR